MERKEIHEKILYPVTRVRASDSGGSGVLVYSEPDPENPDEYINIALTCQHVIDKNIIVKDEWDAVLKRDIKRDIMQEVSVEIFDYDGSKIVSANSTSSEIIAYDKNHDLAAVKLNNTRKMPYVSSIIPRDEIKNIHIADTVWVSACSLLHDPFPNSGTLTSLREMIDQKAYIMQNAPSIFGNSGVVLFHGDTGHLLGLTSRITVTQMGFGMDVQAWMGFSTHPDRIYEFLGHQELQFIYDDNDNYYDALERRAKVQKDSLRNLFLEDKGADKVPDAEPAGGKRKD